MRVPTKLMAHARDAARSYGKSDPIDALAVARAAIREPDLPVAQLDGPAREVCGCWLTTATTWSPSGPGRSTVSAGTCTSSTRTGSRRPAACGGPNICVHPGPTGHRWRHRRPVSPRAGRALPPPVDRDPPAGQGTRRAHPAGSGLLELCGCATLTAAKIVGETADVRRFRSRHAFARHNGTAPLPVWSGNRERHRLSRSGNGQLNAAIHRVAITQAHYHPDARRFLERRRDDGDTKCESIRALKRGLTDVIYRALLLDAESATDADTYAAA